MNLNFKEILRFKMYESYFAEKFIFHRSKFKVRGINSLLGGSVAHRFLMCTLALGSKKQLNVSQG